MKSILILGVGGAQEDAVLTCRQKGLRVFACSNREEGPALKHADFFDKIDIVNKEKVLEFVKAKNIDLVYSVGSDVAIPTISFVSEKMGFPNFVSFDVSQACQNKDRMRSKLGKQFAWNVECQSYDASFSGIEIPFPLIIKPVDSQGSRGVRLVTNKEEFEINIIQGFKYSRSGRIILEKYIEGPEVNVNGYVVDGEVRFAHITDRVSWPQYPGRGIVRFHRTPSSVLSETMELEVRRLVEQAVNGLGIYNGPVYLQIIIGRDKPYLIEATPRLDGGHIWRLLRFALGVDLLDITFDHLLGKAPSIERFAPKCSGRKDWELEFFYETTGEKVQKCKYDLSDAAHNGWYYEDGDLVQSVNGFFEKVGYAIRKK